MSGHWLSKARRAALYARDGHACAYCLSRGSLTLDHLRPRARGGSNASRNLVTACLRCNSSRGDRSLRSFCIAVGSYLNVDWRLIQLRVKASARRKVYVNRKQADTKDSHRDRTSVVRSGDRKPNDSSRHSGCVVRPVRGGMQVLADLAGQTFYASESALPRQHQSVPLVESAIQGGFCGLGDAASQQARMAIVRSPGFLRIVRGPHGDTPGVVQEGDP